MKVVSLFSGIGGLDHGFIDSGYEVIWANDFDKYACQTYNSNNAKSIMHYGDITKIPVQDIPEHDVLIGGFPCQPFSMMGHEKGFEDTRGTLFFRIAEIISYQIEHNRAPKVIVLENVRRLLTHDNKNTFKTIKRTLENLGYKVFYEVLNSADYGVPQVRNRLFIVCFLNKEVNFQFPSKQELRLDMHGILEKEVDEKYYLSEKIKKTILSNGTGGYIAKSEINLSPARPLCASMAKMHRACQDNYYSEAYILGNGNNDRIRRLTPRECARLQGFDDNFIIEVSDAQAYKQFGNAVTVNVARAVANSIKNKLIEIGEWN